MTQPTEARTATSDAAATNERVDLAPATGVSDAARAELAPEEEPVVTGTLFLGLLFLMMVFGFWITLYLTLLNR